MQELGNKLMRSQLMTPGWNDVFNAYLYTPPEELKVLILGQDPYPIKGQAHGLAFSSGNGIRPYSLDIIFKDLKQCDYDERTRSNSDLTAWAKQGVMLLNTCLTTEIGTAFAHKDWGWELLIRHTLQEINRLPQPFVVFAWGKPAQKMIDANIQDTDKHLVLKADHPAATRYGGNFIGSKHFQKADEFFKANGIDPVDWFHVPQGT